MEHPLTGHNDLSEPMSGPTIASVICGFRARWKLFVGCVLLAWLLLLGYVLVTPLQFAASVEFYFVDHSGQSQPQLGSGLSSLIASTGLGTSQASGREIAVATLKSHQLATNFVQKYKLLPVLFSGRWDSAKMQWKVTPDKIPTVKDGALYFSSKVLDVKDDAALGTISVVITMPRRDLVAPIANNYVQLADAALRERALQESQDSLTYLQNQLASISTAELRASAVNLMMSQLQSMMFTKTQKNYSFRVIDQAIEPMIHTGPSKMLLAAVLTVAGLFCAAFISIGLDLRMSGYLP
jgi:uncharacterized protein involved in exopolysaccharide biosynthesis